ncbi:MAG: M43 family zinc metalloprotease [Bacteroidia bacterium]|nr:M43 family zinc metalloprotease [Bacteroidia bacterium]
MSKYLLLAVFLSWIYPAFSQDHPVRCATMEADQIFREMYPQLGSRDELEAWIQEQMAAGGGVLPIEGSILTIPVIVHIIHNGEPVGSGTNISWAQVASQIDVLNEDYRRILGTPGHNTHPNGADVEIEFCLATLDPDSTTLAEQGVERIHRSDLALNAPPYTVSYCKSNIQPQTFWDPNRYMNIWTVDLANDYLGYAQLPNASTLPDLATSYGTGSTDGVVIRPTSFGRVGNLTSPYDKGRTLTHEVGHWLGLWHIWGDGNCSVDDYCTDTPNSDSPNYGCPVGHVSCGSVNMIENYMDYTDDVCMNIFTQCQKTRMRTVMENSPRRGILSSSTVCSVEIPPKAAFVVSRTEICEGSKIQFTDVSNNNPDTWLWSFPGGNPSSSSLQNPEVTYSSQGTYGVILQVSNPYGMDSLVKNTFIQVNSSGPSVFFSENFENGLGEWSVANPDNKITWEIKDVAGSLSGSKAMGISLYDYAVTGARDGLVSPVIDLRTNEQVVLDFHHAHRRFSNNESDSLLIYASTDGGQTYPHILYRNAENGSGNFATNANWFTSFVPASADDWCFSGTGWAGCISLDLSEFDGEEKFRLKFESYNDYGNNIFLDNITLTGVCAASTAISKPTIPTSRLNIFPNPNEGIFTVEAENLPPGPLEIRLFNMMGQPVWKNSVLSQPGRYRDDIYLTDVPPGTYLIRIYSVNFEVHQKILIR